MRELIKRILTEERDSEERANVILKYFNGKKFDIKGKFDFSHYIINVNSLKIKIQKLWYEDGIFWMDIHFESGSYNMDTNGISNFRTNVPFGDPKEDGTLGSVIRRWFRQQLKNYFGLKNPTVMVDEIFSDPTPLSEQTEDRVQIIRKYFEGKKFEIKKAEFQYQSDLPIYVNSLKFKIVNVWYEDGAFWVNVSLDEHDPGTYRVDVFDNIKFIKGGDHSVSSVVQKWFEQQLKKYFGLKKVVVFADEYRPPLNEEMTNETRGEQFRKYIENKTFNLKSERKITDEVHYNLPEVTFKVLNVYVENTLLEVLNVHIKYEFISGIYPVSKEYKHRFTDRQLRPYNDYQDEDDVSGRIEWWAEQLIPKYFGLKPQDFSVEAELVKPQS